MTFDPYPEFLTIEQAAAYRGVSVATIRRVLRAHGLGDFTRASMGKQVLLRRADIEAMDLEKSVSMPPRRANRRRGAA
jgi:excisionase family DNA binding protein